MQTVTLREIDLTTEPAIEYIGGRAAQKVLPTDWHAFLQLAFARHLDNWAHTTGKVGTEWRFILPPDSYTTTSVVPDVAYLSNERYFALAKPDRKYPPIAPEIVVEILSPDDRAIDVAAKRRFYLAWGVKLLILVDPEAQTVESHEIANRFATFARSDTFTSAEFPTLWLPLAEIFATIDEPA